jgi:15-cis-phytoene desaturase
MKTDVIVIGGGMAGLASGALLAKQGLRVAVLEKGNRPGGRAYTYMEQGFTLNYGPHAMYRPDSGPLGDVLRRLGRPVIAWGAPDAMRTYWAGGRRFAVIGDKTHQVLTTKLFSLKTKVRLGQVMLGLRGAKSEMLGEMTVGAWLREQAGGDAELTRFLRMLITVNTYTRNPEDLSARFAIGHLQRHLFAKDYVGYVSGGWGAIYGGFIESLRAAGGELVTGAGVERLETDGGRVTAAIAGGRRYEAAAFVCTLAPQDAPSIAAAGSPLAAELARWSGLQDVRALCIDLGFERVLRDDLTAVFDMEHDLYFSIHSAIAPDLAPAGGQMLHAMAYLSPEDAATDAGIAARRTDLEAGLDRYFAGWREAATVRRELPSARVSPARETPEQQGGARVPPRSSVVENLYFAGDGRDTGYALAQGALVSALEVADVVPAALRAPAMAAAG